jgi:hypothetical protein
MKFTKPEEKKPVKAIPKAAKAKAKPKPKPKPEPKIRWSQIESLIQEKNYGMVDEWIAGSPIRAGWCAPLAVFNGDYKKADEWLAMSDNRAGECAEAALMRGDIEQTARYIKLIKDEDHYHNRAAWLQRLIAKGYKDVKTR